MFKKAIIMGVAAVGAMSLVGTGFAGWVISRTVREEAQGNVTAYSVANESVTVSIDISEDEIIFGVPTGYDPEAVEGKWLTATDVEEQVLSTTFTVTVSNIPTSKKGYLSYKLVTPEISSDLATLTISGDGNSAGPVYNLSKTPDGQGVAVFTFTLTYAWGSKFDGKNPYVYYNQEIFSEARATAATTDLTALKNAADGGHFTLTVVCGTSPTATDAAIFAAPAQQSSND